MRVVRSSLKNQRALILVLGCLAAMGPMSIDLYLPAFPLLMAEFATDAASVSQTMASYFAGIALGQLLYGPLSDNYGRRSPLVAGLILYLVGSLLCSLATSVEALIIFRAVQALGGCAGMVICRAVVRDLFPAEQMAQVYSSLLLVMGLAPVLAPSVGAVIVDWQGWRVLFALMALFAILCLWGTFRQIPREHAAMGKRLSVRGSLRVYAELLRHRVFLSYSVSATFVRCALFAYITGSPFLYQDFYGLSPQRFGVVFGCNAAGFVLGSQGNGRLVSRYGHQRVYRQVLGLTVLATLPLLGSHWVQPSYELTELSLFLFVTSLGFSFPCATTGALADQPDRAGSASALMGLMGSVAAAATALGVGSLQSITPMALPLLVGGASLAGWLAFIVLDPESANSLTPERFQGH